MMTKELKKVVNWLDVNGIEYEIVNFGGSYFGPEYSWQAITIAFYWDGIGNSYDMMHAFEAYAKRSHKNVTFKYGHFGAGVRYDVFYTPDYEEYKKYEVAVQDAVETYWNKRHEEALNAAEGEAA